MAMYVSQVIGTINRWMCCLFRLSLRQYSTPRDCDEATLLRVLRAAQAVGRESESC